MCRLRITGQVNFTKACFVKGIIQKASEEVRLSNVLSMLTMLGSFTQLCDIGVAVHGVGMYHIWYAVSM